MYHVVQAIHPKTLRACLILATCTSKRDPEIGFRDMMDTVMESGPPGSQLNLKVLAYHEDSLRAGDPPPLDLVDLKQVLMPRQWLLKKLDPRGNLTVPVLRDVLQQCDSI